MGSDIVPTYVVNILMEGEMSRKTKEYRTKENTYSLQLYKRGEFVGSIPFRELCQIIQKRRNTGTDTVLAHKSPE